MGEGIPIYRKIFPGSDNDANGPLENPIARGMWVGRLASAWNSMWLFVELGYLDNKS